MRFVIIKFALITLMISISSEAIVNIEAVRPDWEAIGYSGQLQLNSNGNFGNTNVFGVRFATNSVWNTGLSQSLLLLSYRYGKSNSARNANESFAHLRYVQKIKDRGSLRRYLEVFLQSQANEFRRLSIRGLAGTGQRFEWDIFQESEMAIGAGVFYSYERRTRLKGERPIDQTNVRGNFYWSTQVPTTAGSSFVMAVYYQPKMESLNNYYAFINTVFQASWTEQVTLNFEVTLTHNSHPPKDVRKTDFTYSSGFTVKL